MVLFAAESMWHPINKFSIWKQIRIMISVNKRVNNYFMEKVSEPNGNSGQIKMSIYSTQCHFISWYFQNLWEGLRNFHEIFIWSRDSDQKSRIYFYMELICSRLAGEHDGWRKVLSDSEGLILEFRLCTQVYVHSIMLTIIMKWIESTLISLPSQCQSFKQMTYFRSSLSFTLLNKSTVSKSVIW